MDEFKVIIYLVLGVGYLLFKAYSKNKEKVIANKPKQETPSVSPKSIQEILDEIKKQSEAASPTAAPTATTPTATPTATKHTSKPKEIFVEEKANTDFEEGKSSPYRFERTFGNEEGAIKEDIKPNTPIRQSAATYKNKAKQSKKEIFIAEKTDESYEEGVSSVYHYEETFHNNEGKSNLISTNEANSSSPTAEEGILGADMQKAFIASLIFEKKF